MNISWGTRPSDAVGMHVAAWVLGESLMHLATVWSPAEVRCCLACLTLILTCNPTTTPCFDVRHFSN